MTNFRNSSAMTWRPTEFEMPSYGPGGKRPRCWSKHQAAQMSGVREPFLFVDSAAVDEPSSDFSHNFVDLVGLQKRRLLFQLRAPSHQDLIFPLLLVIAVVCNLLDDPFPRLKTHRFSFLDFGPPHAQRLFRADEHDQSLPLSQGSIAKIALTRYRFQFVLRETEGARNRGTITSFSQVMRKITAVRAARAMNNALAQPLPRA